MAKNTKESDVVLNFRMNGEVAYSKTIKEINNDMKLAALEYKNQISGMDKNASATEKLTAAKQKLEKQLAISTAKTEGLREEYKKAAEETGENSEKTQKLYEMLLKAETSENNLRKALDSTNDALDAQGNKALTTAEKLEKIEKAGEKIGKVGKGLSAGITAPVVGVATVGVQVFNELSNAQKLVESAFGMTKKEAESMNTAIENIFASGMVGSIDEAKEAVMMFANQFPELRTQSSDAIEDMIKQAMALEKTFDSDMEETMRGANALMTTYGMTGQEAMDYITVATQNGLDKTHELGDNLAEYAVQFKQNGYSAEEMFEILNSGLNGGAYNLDKVNDLVKEMGIRISDGTIQTAVEGLGGEWQSMYETMKSSGASNNEIFEALASKISTVGDETEKAALVSTIFGSLGEDNAVQVIEAMSGLSQEVTGVEGAYDGVTGAAKNMVDGVGETVTLQSAMNTVMLAASDVGEQLAPTINSVANAVRDLASWFRSLDGNTKNAIMTIAGIAAAVGPVLVVLGTLMSSVTKVAGGIKTLQGVFSAMKLAFAANPFVLVIAGIALLVAGLVMAYQKCEWFRNGVNAFFKGVSDVAVEVFNFISGYIAGAFNGIWQNITNVFDAIKRIFTGFINFITGVFAGDWSMAWQGLVDIFGGIIDGIVAVAKIPINNMIGLINSFLGGLNNIKIPDFVPGIGGKSFNIATIPYLAKGGHLINNQAVVGEAGPELLSVANGKTTVTPLSDKEKRNGIGGKIQTGKVEQHIHIGNVDANNPSELNKMNRKFYRASQQALGGVGG